MNEIFIYVGSFAAGMVLAVVYMLLLWRSLRGIEDMAPSPFRIMTGYVLRLLVVATGLLFVMSGDVKRLLIAVGGFALMQIVLIRTVGRRIGQDPEGGEGS